MEPKRELRASARRASGEPRVVYTQAPLALAPLLGRRGERWGVLIGGGERELPAASDVDPALLEAIAARGGRVLVETVNGAAQIAGGVQTRRALEIDEEGAVDAQVTSFRVRAKRELLLTTERAFVWVKGQDVELYGKEILTRAKEVAKILGRLISLN